MTAIPATLRLRREGALRSRAARGDAVAFAAVYERHHQALYRYCRSILRHEEDAQDALQSTMTRAFAALQDERRDFELRPWLFRIAHNEAISILRRRRTTAELADVPDERPIEDRVAEREELRLLQLDLADLPERQRAALVLRELNGLSHAEIGVVLELSPGAVKQAIFEARSALFSCREGREMACHDVRRMLSDGDGRVLRGRGVRAHLRSCPDCQPLPRRPRAAPARAEDARRRRCRSAGAAALLAELLGAERRPSCWRAWRSSGGGGARLAVEMRDAPKRAPVVAERAETPRSPTATPAPARRAEVAPPPVKSAARPDPDRSERLRAERRERRRPPRKRAAAAPVAPPGAVPVRSEAPAAAQPEQRKAEKKPKRAKKPKANKSPRAERPPRAKQPPAAQPPPPQAAPPAQPGPPAHAQARGKRESAERRAAAAPPAPVPADDEGENDDDD